MSVRTSAAALLAACALMTGLAAAPASAADQPSNDPAVLADAVSQRSAPRYSEAFDPTDAEQVAAIDACTPQTCMVIGVPEGESVLDGLVRVVAADPASGGQVLDYLDSLTDESSAFVADKPGEDRGRFDADAANVRQAVELELSEPGAGLAHRGLADPGIDPVDSIAVDSPTIPGVHDNGGNGTIQSDYVWYWNRDLNYVFTVPGGAVYAGTTNAYYRISLNGRQARWYQRLSVPFEFAGDEFKLGANDNTCRIDVSFGGDYNCEEQPIVTNGFGIWDNNLRQPSSGYDNVYDADWKKKFFEFQHQIAWRSPSNPNASSPYSWTGEGQSHRFECKSSWGECRF